MISFLNQKFSGIRHNFRGGYNNLTDKIETIFIPSPETRLERLRAGNGTLADYNYFIKLIGVAKKDYTDSTSIEFISCAAEAHTIIEVTSRTPKNFFVISATNKFQKIYGFPDCIVVEKVATKIDGTIQVFIKIKSTYEVKALTSANPKSFITNVSESLIDKSTRFDPVVKKLGPDCTQNLVILRDRGLTGHSNIPDDELLKLAKDAIKSGKIEVYVMPESSSSTEGWLTVFTRTDRCPKSSKELLDTIIRNKQERPKLLSRISDNIYHNTDLWGKYFLVIRAYIFTRVRYCIYKLNNTFNI